MKDEDEFGPVTISEQEKDFISPGVAAAPSWCSNCKTLKDERNELYLMLDAIVQTHNAGYAFMDMKAPSQLLYRMGGVKK